MSETIHYNPNPVSPGQEEQLEGYLNDMSTLIGEANENSTKDQFARLYAATYRLQIAEGGKEGAYQRQRARTERQNAIRDIRSDPRKTTKIRLMRAKIAETTRFHPASLK